MSWAEVDVIKKEIANHHGAIKSVQRGTIKSVNNEWTSATINPVNMNKTVVLPTNNGKYDGGNSGGTFCNAIGFELELKDSTTVQVLAKYSDTRVGFCVIEYY